MTGYGSDCCPACGSQETQPYAVILGASEEYGYQCLACQVMWPVLTHPARRKPARPASADRSPAA